MGETRRKTSRGILMALLFVGPALALPVACMNADDAETDSQWSAVTTTNCDTQDGQGNYVIPRCDERCLRDGYAAELIGSGYNIKATLGLGEHTGSAIL